jgi:hypothetical protein
MTFYIIGWCLMFSCAGIWLATGRLPKWPVFLILCYCALLAFLRGQTGTDTEFYQNMFAAVQLGNIQWTVEGAFALVAQGLLTITPSSETAVRAVSLIFFALLAMYTARATNDELWILLVFILPIFSYQYSMNTIRVGLGSAMFLVCVQALGRKYSSRRSIYCLLPSAFHYSLILSAMYLLISTSASRPRNMLLTISILLVASGVILTFASEYLYMKEQLYVSYSSPNELSGFARAVLVAVIATGLLVSSAPRKVKLVLILPAVVTTIACMLIANKSYAGLRSLDLLLFVLPLTCILVYQVFNVVVDRSVQLAVLCAGVLGAAAVGRNFMQDAEQGPAPFVPYESRLHVRW